MTAASSSHSASSLAGLLQAKASAKEIETFLDGLSPAARLEQVLSITGAGVGRLYHAVADAPALSLEEFFPQSVNGTLIYEGRNSLPMFTRFQKRFARAPSGEIVGYNHQTMSVVTGPGYFITKAPSGQGEHGKEILFDYTERPTFFPEGWPAFKPNESGLSRFVYRNMKDYVRRVARGVVVGKAYELDVDKHAYFSLTRST